MKWARTGNGQFSHYCQTKNTYALLSKWDNTSRCFTKLTSCPAFPSHAIFPYLHAWWWWVNGLLLARKSLWWSNDFFVGTFHSHFRVWHLYLWMRGHNVHVAEVANVHLPEDVIQRHWVVVDETQRSNWQRENWVYCLRGSCQQKINADFVISSWYFPTQITKARFHKLLPWKQMCLPW